MSSVRDNGTMSLLRLMLLLTAPPGWMQLGEARISGFHIDYELCSGQLSGTCVPRSLVTHTALFVVSRNSIAVGEPVESP